MRSIIKLKDLLSTIMILIRKIGYLILIILSITVPHHCHRQLYTTVVNIIASSLDSYK